MRTTLSAHPRATSTTLTRLDVVRMLSIRKRALDAIEGELGDVLREGSARWFRHRLLRKASLRFPMSDLIAALYELVQFAA